jgi:hypothetical protein
MASKLVTWACTVCTFANSSMHLACEMCLSEAERRYPLSLLELEHEESDVYVDVD